MNLTQTRKEMKHMASELTDRLQYSPNLYTVRFNIEDGEYTILDYNNKLLLDYKMDRSNPYLILWLDGYKYISSIYKKKLSVYKEIELGKLEDIEWNEFKEVYNKISYEHQI